MIDDLDRTIRELLNQELPRVQTGKVDVAFFPPNRDWRREGSALNFFLYDVRENAHLRQHRWQEVHGEEGGSRSAENPVQLRRTPLRLDCFYMVTAWSADPMDEHRLLTECLIALARHPVLNQAELDEQKLREQYRQRGEPLPKDKGQWRREVMTMRIGNGRIALPSARPRPHPLDDFLVGALRGQEHEIRTRVAFHDVMTNPAEIWSSLENTMKAALSYVVTLPINPWQDLEEGAAAVGAVTFKANQGAHPVTPTATPTVAAAVDPRRSTYVGGLVKMTPFPADGLEVWLVEKGISTRVDNQGRFVFRRAPLGTYTLEVRTIKEQTALTQRTITIPVAGSGHGHLIVIDIAPPQAAVPPTDAINP